ncbi:hypothetical protein [Acuticoccus kandeliae]|uniref:hypothetical protein n=1 Tax=Acuticoccus kandeliae TaxID=2073160 RepID=UPI001472717D|nr:hypothetical protein [Acuticoccus kandeliae]
MAQQMKNNDIRDLLMLLEVELCYLCADNSINLSEEIIRIISVLRVAAPATQSSSDESAKDGQDPFRKYYQHNVSLRRDH